MAITTIEEVESTLGITDKSEQISLLIPQVEEWIEGYTNESFKDDVYPRGYKKIAIKMIDYDLARAGKQDVQSESLSRHSITYATSNDNEYPSAITKGLRRRLRW